MTAVIEPTVHVGQIWKHACSTTNCYEVVDVVGAVAEMRAIQPTGDSWRITRSRHRDVPVTDLGRIGSGWELLADAYESRSLTVRTTAISDLEVEVIRRAVRAALVEIGRRTPLGFLIEVDGQTVEAM